MWGHDNRELAAVFVGGALGTLARAVLATVAAPHPDQWPWATFVAVSYTHLTLPTIYSV